MSTSTSPRFESSRTPLIEVREAFAAFFAPGQRYLLCVAHRRAGKTTAALQRLIWSALRPTQPHARYAFIAPLRTQAKMIAWDALKILTSSLPGVTYQEVELTSRFRNGSKLTLYGADNPDSLKGSYFDGVVLDEYAQMDPKTYDEVVRPMLVDRQGWVFFIGTFKGRNAFFRLYERYKNDPQWTVRMLRASETHIIPRSELSAMRADMSDEMYLQEMECDASVSSKGLIYQSLIQQLRAQDRIGDVPYDPSLPVHTAWDLGVRNATAIWLLQATPTALHAIDYIESSGAGLPYYISLLNQRPYAYSRHYAPHDIQVQEFGTGKTRQEIALSHGITFERARRLSLQDGIEATRCLLPRMRFDATKTQRGLECLEAYHYEWDAKLHAFRQTPADDWSSHGADALRTYATSLAPAAASALLGPRDATGSARGAGPAIPIPYGDWEYPINSPHAAANQRRTRFAR